MPKSKLTLYTYLVHVLGNLTKFELDWIRTPHPHLPESAPNFVSTVERIYGLDIMSRSLKMVWMGIA